MLEAAGEEKVAVGGRVAEVPELRDPARGGMEGWGLWFGGGRIRGLGGGNRLRCNGRPTRRVQAS